MADFKGAEAAQADTLERIKELIVNVSDNPGAIVFPTDQWGFTSQVRKAVLTAASTVRGQDDKHLLLVGTLSVLLAHIKARLPKDKQYQADRLASQAVEEAARTSRERVRATPAPVTN